MISYLFLTFGYVVSSFLHRLLFSCSERGLLSSHGGHASHSSGFSCGAQPIGHSSSVQSLSHVQLFVIP